jgi:hypothetical protein
MKLRDHPVMTRRTGARSWPPQWTTAAREYENELPFGEVGTLRAVWKHELLDSCVFLFIEYNRSRYTGSLYFDNPESCKEMDALFKSKVGCSIKEIGDLELS